MRERDDRDRPGRAGEVDQLPVAEKGRTVFPVARSAVADGEALQALDLEGRPADDPPGSVSKLPLPSRARGVGEALCAAEELALALVVDLGRREDEVPGGAVRVHEGVVLEDPLAFGVSSLNWMSYAITFAPSAFRFLITRAWDLARERPALAELAERRVVDLHDHDVLRRVILAADREAAVDAAELRAAEDVPARPAARSGVLP